MNRPFLYKLTLFFSFLLTLGAASTFEMAHGPQNYSLRTQSSKESVNQKVVVWDCGGVLMHPPQSLSVLTNHIGPKLMARYLLLSWGTPSRVQKLSFTILHQIPASKTYFHRSTHNGIELPLIMHDWLCGFQSNTEIIKAVFERIHAPENNCLFLDSVEKELVGTIIKEVIFNPTMLATLSYPIKHVLPVLKKLETKGYRLMILSNWDPYSFDQLFEAPHTQHIFKFFDRKDVMISGECGMCKPDPEFFEYFLATYNLDPNNCLFIDDHEENTRAAQSVGMHAHWLQNNDYAALEKSLIKHGYYAA